MQEGEIVGKLVYRLNGKEIGQVDVVAAQEVPKETFFDVIREVWEAALL